MTAKNVAEKKQISHILYNIVHVENLNYRKQKKERNEKTMETKKTKLERCMYCHQFMGKNHDENHCVADGWEDEKIRNVTEAE